MSRINEAIKRMLNEPGADSAERFTLSEFPRETGAARSGGPSSEVRQDAPPVPVPLSRVVVSRSVPATVTTPLHAARPVGRAVVVPARDEACLRLEEVVAAVAAGGRRALMVTSALAHEGKTETACSVSLGLSESHGRRVLIIDASLRHPAVHATFGVRNDTGLSEVLRGEVETLPLIDVTPAVSVLTAGQADAANAFVALTAARLRSVIDECAARFDSIIIDAPSIGDLPGLPLLAHGTDGVIFVIGHRSAFPVVHHAIAALERDRIVATLLRGVKDPLTPN